jgi:hypothetical protein
VPGTAGPASIPLGGSAYTRPVLKVAPASLSFEANAGTTSYPASVQLADTGSRQVDISALAISSADASAFAITGAPCSVVPGEGVCSFDVVFTPSVAGTFSATLMIKSDAANGPRTITLSGTGY